MARRTGRVTGTGGRGNTRRGVEASAASASNSKGVPANARRGTQATEVQANRSSSVSSKRKSIVEDEGADHDTVEVSSGRAKSGSVEARSSLRGKFMGTMAGLTAATLIFLGGLLAYTSSSFVSGISMHKGVELAKMTAMLVRVQLDAAASDASGEDIALEIREYINGASSWQQDSEASNEYSDILNINVYGGKLGGYALKGEAQKGGASMGPKYAHIFVPRVGNVTLGDDIEVYQITYKGTPCFRYKIQIAGPQGIGFASDDSAIAVDIAADAITAVNFKMYLYIGFGICASMVLVVFVSARFTNKITKPINILVRDMSIVSKGDLSHRTKPHSNDEIGVLAHAFNKMTSNLKTAQDAMVEQEKAAYEMNLAKEVQQQLLPQGLPKLDNFEIASYYLGAKAVSGDYFDFIPLGEGIWGFIIADVSGKGIPGSMVMAQCRTVVRLVANQYPQHASETLKKTNRLLAKQIKRGMFVTAFYAILNENTGEITYSSAGHNPLIIYRAATKTYELATPKGIAIGFNEGPLFDKNIQEESAVLGPGDSFMLYTDGFPEAMNADEEEFGDDEFYDIVAKAGHLPVGQMKDSVVEAIAKHRGSAPQSDDLTLIAVKRKA